MKKTVCFGLLAIMLVFGLLVIGCSSGPKIWDSSVSEEQSSFLYAYPASIIYKIDNKSTGLMGIKANFSYKPGILIPAGEHTIEMIEDGGLQHTAVGTYEFLPGHHYSLRVGTNLISWFVELADITELDNTKNLNSYKWIKISQ